MKPLNQELKDIRIEKGVTLDEIYRETKIRIPFLEKIEEGDFSVVPEPFMRAFLREYAETVGVDPERVISKYEGKSVSIRDENDLKDVKETPAGINASLPKVERAPEKQPSSPKKKEESSTTPVEQSMPETKIISDEPASPRTRDNASPGQGRVLPVEEEAKSPRTILFGVFAVVIIMATLVILYLNGIISF